MNLTIPTFFLTYVDDDENDSEAKNSATQMPTALIASALYGTTYMSRKRAQNSCSVSERNESWPKRDVQSQYTSRQSPNQVPEQSQRIDGGSALGMFDVSIFDQNTGFFVKHENSGESIEVTIFLHDKDTDRKRRYHNDKNGASTVVTVDSYNPARSKEKKEDGMFQSFLGFSLPKILTPTHDSSSSRGMKNSPQNEYQRSVLISDLDGHAFFCEVELKRPLIPSGHSKSSGTKGSSGIPQRYETIATFPCLGAMYGRTQMAHLVEAGGVEVEADLRTPDKLDKFGCGDSVSSEEEENEDHLSFVQLTRRGVCTFRHKALHHIKRKSSAEAIIIINSEQEKIFLMVGNEGDEALEHKIEDEPISVLVSEEDGNSIISLVEKYESNVAHNNGNVQALVRISEQQQLTDASSNVVEKWPVVNTASESKKIQVLASSGWGVVAVQNSDSQSDKDWQIMILQHAFNDLNNLQT